MGALDIRKENKITEKKLYELDLSPILKDMQQKALVKKKSLLEEMDMVKWAHLDDLYTIDEEIMTNSSCTVQKVIEESTGNVYAAKMFLKDVNFSNN